MYIIIHGARAILVMAFPGTVEFSTVQAWRAVFHPNEREKKKAPKRRVKEKKGLITHILESFFIPFSFFCVRLQFFSSSLVCYVEALSNCRVKYREGVVPGTV